MSRRNPSLIFVVAALLVLTACQSSASGEPSGEPSGAASEPAESVAAQEPFELSLAHSYQPTQPQVVCGAEVIKEEVEAADVGITIEIFGASELGPDAERIQSVIAGDIDMDIQGASALSAVYAPMSAVDGAFVFDDSAHMYSFFTSEASDALTQGFEEETGVHILGAWNTAPASSPPMFPSGLPLTSRGSGCGSRRRPSSS